MTINVSTPGVPWLLISLFLSVTICVGLQLRQKTLTRLKMLGLRGGEWKQLEIKKK